MLNQKIFARGYKALEAEAQHQHVIAADFLTLILAQGCYQEAFLLSHRQLLVPIEQSHQSGEAE